MNAVFTAGWGAADITPEAPVVELSGQYYQRIARETHSRLKTVALVFSRGNQTAAMISVDSVGLPEAYCNRLRQTLAARIPALGRANIVFNATHTHSAPGLQASRKWWIPHPEALTVETYRDFVEQRIVDAVTSAWSSQQPCGVSPALGAARIGHCRRAVYHNGTAEMYGRTDRSDFAGLEGGEDSGVDMLFFFDRQQHPSGLIVNVACPSQVMEATYAISSDYMGALREKLKAAFGDDFRTLCQISASGCQSPRDLIRNHRSEPGFWDAQAVDRVSDRLLAAVLKAFDGAAGAIDSNPVLSQSVTPLALPRRRACYPDLVASRRALQRLEAELASASAYADFCKQLHQNEQTPGHLLPYDDKLHPFVRMQNHKAVIQRYEDQQANPDFQMPLHVLRIGQAAFAANPFELYLEYGQRIKARSPARQTFVIQLANGIGGYLPTARAETLGGYGGLIINGQVGSDGGAKLVDDTLTSIQALWQDAGA